jgi:hypothetical protein
MVQQQQFQQLALQPQQGGYGAPPGAQVPWQQQQQYGNNPYSALQRNNGGRGRGY